MGINQNLAPVLYQDPLLRELYQCIPNPTRLARDRDVHHPKPRLPRKKTKNYLKSKGFRWALYHKGVLRDRAAECTERWLKDSCQDQRESADFILCTLP